MIAFLEDEGDINFVVDGWDNIFLGFVFVSDDEKVCEIRPNESMEDGRTSHITSPNLLARAETLW